MLTFEHSSGAEGFGFLNLAEWLVPISPLSAAVISSPSSCRGLVVADLSDGFPHHEVPARAARPEASRSTVAPVGAGASPVQPLPSPELAIVVAGVIAVFIWPRKVKRLLRGIVDGPKLF